MYSAENYLWGWVGYGLGVFLLMLGVWGMMRRLRWSWLRHGLLLVLAALLLTPMKPYADSPFLAPAVFVSVFESLGALPESGVTRGFLAIGVVLAVLLLLYGGCVLLWRLRR